jgi:hypothetical protein
MNKFLLIAISFCVPNSAISQKVFDVHIHGTKDIDQQLNGLHAAGIYKAAISTSWELQSSYRSKSKISILYGLMLPCPNGKVPYSQQTCFTDGKEFPEVSWVEQQIKDKKIDFIGEVLTQYYGISPSDTIMYPYYTLAEKYSLPVGIHTGLAGPGHGSPNFKVELGSPLLLEKLLIRFPKLKVWIMHAGAPFLENSIAMMTVYRNVYADISALTNPYIFPPAQFKTMMKTFVDAGLEDRIMFGSDNGPIDKTVNAVVALDFLSDEQRAKIFYKNAEKFFHK